MKSTSSRTRRAAAKASDDRDEFPAVTPALARRMVEQGSFSIEGKPVSRVHGQAAFAAKLGKQRISIMIDSSTLAHFRAKAGDRGYQTLINDALRRAVEGEAALEQIRQAVREEIGAYEVRRRKR